MSDHTARRQNGDRAANGGRRKQRLPVLIFPGFMSSGLEVKKSPVKSTSLVPSQHGGTSPSTGKGTWEGKQVWLNVKSAGFESMYFGSALRANEILRENGEAYNEPMHLQYKQENECKSRWIQHMKLANDMHSDVEGIQVRSVEGLKAVNHLIPSEGALAKHLSWVFLPITEVLQKEGYQDGYTLDAAPYDWRLPPCVLEERDGYFSKTMKRVEKMYTDNNDTPVVLLCHSMGCKTCHYFLNFALVHPKGGQAWLDKYIHTYMPVGAPHLGAPKSLRGALDGDKMGLESFLSDEEALIFGRTWGSVPWLFPGQLPPTNAPTNAFMRREGVLHITVRPFNCENVFHGEKRPAKLRLCVAFAGKTLHSKFQTPEGDNSVMSFTETFTFAAPPDLPGNETSYPLRISLEESLLWKIRKKTIWGHLKNGVSKWLCCCRFFPCVFVRETVAGVVGLSVAAADTLATLMGSTNKLAESEEHDISEMLKEGNPVEFPLQVIHVSDTGAKERLNIFAPMPPTEVTLQAEWKPPQHDVDTDELCNFAVARHSDKSPQLQVEHVKDKGVVYESVNGVQLLRSEWLLPMRDVMYKCYDPDLLGPRTLSAEGAPPVKRVKAVYGVNLPTEVGAVYRRRNIVQEKGKVQKVHKLDADARLVPNPGYEIEKGSILESCKTPQIVAGSRDGKVVHRSGDGTVPYWSLQHCRTWQDKCDVTVNEIERAEHREILADERFHRILLDYLITDEQQKR